MNVTRDSIEQDASPPTKPSSQRVSGVIIGVLLGIDGDGAPLVAFPGNPSETALKARTTAQLRPEDIGREVALLFEGGDLLLPLLIGVVQHPEREAPTRPELSAQVDGERVVLAADREIVLKCGKASITLTRAGKILIRGVYLLSRSSGVNRIKGGSVQIN